MPTPTTASWPRPTSESEFEEIALDALRLIWRDPCASRVGRRGQAQHGVDIQGETEGRVLGAQCKNVHFLTEAQLDEIVREADSFTPPLDVLVVAISGPRDSGIQSVATALSLRRSQAGQFGVRLLFWEDLCSKIAAVPELVSKHWPGWPCTALGTEAAAPRLRVILEYALFFEKASLVLVCVADQPVTLWSISIALGTREQGDAVWDWEPVPAGAMFDLDAPTPPLALHAGEHLSITLSGLAAEHVRAAATRDATKTIKVNVWDVEGTEYGTEKVRIRNAKWGEMSIR